MITYQQLHQDLQFIITKLANIQQLRLLYGFGKNFLMSPSEVRDLKDMEQTLGPYVDVLNEVKSLFALWSANADLVLMPLKKNINVKIVLDKKKQISRLLAKKKSDPNLLMNEFKQLSMYLDSVSNIARENVLETLKLQEIQQWKPKPLIELNISTPENHLSHTFEDRVSQYLVDHYHYEVRTRYKPPYLNGELDVYARKGIGEVNLTVCECKLRLKGLDSPISMAEVQAFQLKIEKVKENESKVAQVKYRFWLVTNIDKVEHGVQDYAKRVKIEIMKADLSSNWDNRADWSVVKMSSLI